jgi:hypothetical protein
MPSSQFSFLPIMSGNKNNAASTKRKECKSNRRPSKYKSIRPSNVDKFSYELALQTIGTKLELIKSNSGGRQLPYGAVTDVVKKMQPTYMCLTKDMVRDHLKTQSKKDRLSASSAPYSAEEMAAYTTEWNKTNATSTTLSTMSRDSGYTIIVRMADDIVGDLHETTPAEAVPAETDQYTTRQHPSHMGVRKEVHCNTLFKSKDVFNWQLQRWQRSTVVLLKGTNNALTPVADFQKAPHS